MERVVYLLGAGFSAPLGLPLVNNFLTRSKDMYASDPKKYKHFADVFGVIDALSKIKNYYEANLFNIEEILSILEMNKYLEGKRLDNTFKQYIIDVINYYTPAIKPHTTGTIPWNWYDWLFGEEDTWTTYGLFVGTLLEAGFRLANPGRFHGTYQDIGVNRFPQSNVSYSVVTLNYDLVLEKVSEFINRNYWVINKPLTFASEISEIAGENKPALAKLHGCISTGVIVPPTWNKANAPDILPAWKLAHHLLTRANHIRVIGYSLPQADAYVKYLLKSALLNNEHLKKIDVICLDRDGSVERRYSEFITFDYYRFCNGSTEEYLGTLKKKYGRLNEKTDLNQLEAAHQEFIESER